MDKAMISVVPSDSIESVWDEVEPLLQRAIDYNGGIFSIQDVAGFLASNTMLLAVGVKDDRIMSAFALEQVTYPRRKGIRVTLAAGEPLRDWLEPMVDMLDSWVAQDPEFSFYEMIGRPGWRKALKGVAHEVATIIRREP